MWQILLYSERQMYSKRQNGFQYGTSSCTAAGRTACTAKGRVAFDEGRFKQQCEGRHTPLYLLEHAANVFWKQSLTCIILSNLAPLQNIVYKMLTKGTSGFVMPDSLSVALTYIVQMLQHNTNDCLHNSFWLC